MPTFKLPGLEGVGTIEELIDEVSKLRKELTWLLYHQDHVNVKRLETEHCDIRSKLGETQIKGPVLEMYDRQASPVLRLRQGYDELTGDFLFEMHNRSGTKTIGIDSNGDATFTGIITGSTIRTGALGTAHLELTGAGLAGITDDGLLNGLVFNPPAGTDIADVFLYHRGAKLVEFYDDITGYVIRGASGASFFGLGGNCPTYAYGSWNFGTASSMSGLVTGTESNHDHGGATGPGGPDGHVHGLSDDGQHYHNVTRG